MNQLGTWYAARGTKREMNVRAGSVPVTLFNVNVLPPPLNAAIAFGSIDFLRCYARPNECVSELAIPEENTRNNTL
jgi:hypothetical protein